jgi:hypothetical protein
LTCCCIQLRLVLINPHTV